MRSNQLYFLFILLFKGIHWPEFVSAQNAGGKMRSLDDSNIGQEPAKNIVPLRSHDFTGLGFNIYGNMRDGIYVKDVSHRGPASESGRIQPGDRITSVRISFQHMVYEDALTILSYASPYDVQIEVENGGGRVSSRPSTLLRNKPNSSSPSERLVHPFFRSQSIPDLAQISSKSSSKRTSMNSHHNTSSHSTHQETTESKPAVLEVSPVTVKTSDKAHKFGIRVLPDMKIEEQKISNHIAPVVLTVENENNSNIVIEHSRTQQKSHSDRADFDEIDLSDKCQPIDEPDNKQKRTNTPSPTTNVKSIIAKGLQNLKDKLHQPHHKKQGSLEIPNVKSNDMPNSESCVIDMSHANHNETESIVKDMPEEVKKVANNAHATQKMFIEHERSFVIDMKAPSPVNGVNKTDSFSSNEGENAKKSKRKAPAPPVTTDVELHAEPSEIVSIKDSDSEMGDSTSTTIELNSTHITVHHVPDDSNRKAASLGDLSKITNDEVSTSVLERAMSLELAEGTTNIQRDSKKRKAPSVPSEELTLEEVPYSKEPRIEAMGSASLKKASLFGTMEEAIQQTDDDSDSLVSHSSGKSSPDLQNPSDQVFVSSTPLKVSNVEVNHIPHDEAHTHNGNVYVYANDNHVPNGEVHFEREQTKPRPAQRMAPADRTIEINTEKISQEKNEDLPTLDDNKEEMITKDIIGDFTKEMNGEFSKSINGDWTLVNSEPKSEGESKDWELSESALNDAYVTALNISVDEKPPDLPTSPPPNMSSYVTEIKVMTQMDNSLEDEKDDILDISDKDMTLLEPECDDSKIFKNGVYFGMDESLLLTSSFTKSTPSPDPIETTNRVPTKLENFIKNMNEPKTTPEVNLSDEQILALKTSNNSKLATNFYKTNGESPSPNKRRIPSKSPSPSGKSPQRGNISVTSIKTSGSRIPVRAFGTSSANTNGSTNGNTSSSSDSSVTSPRSMLPDPKLRKSRKPDESEPSSKFTTYTPTFSISSMSKSNLSSPEQRRFNGTNESSVTQIVVEK